MQRKLASIGFVLVLGVATFGLTGPVASAGPCKYKGSKNGLPTGGLPILVYANGDMSPSGYAGVGDGTSYNYVQGGGNSGGGQVEAKSGAAGQSAYVNTGGAAGSC